MSNRRFLPDWSSLLCSDTLLCSYILEYRVPLTVSSVSVAESQSAQDSTRINSVKPMTENDPTDVVLFDHFSAHAVPPVFRSEILSKQNDKQGLAKIQFQLFERRKVPPPKNSQGASSTLKEMVFFFSHCGHLALTSWLSRVTFISKVRSHYSGRGLVLLMVPLFSSHSRCSDCLRIASDVNIGHLVLSVTFIDPDRPQAQVPSLSLPLQPSTAPPSPPPSAPAPPPPLVDTTSAYIPTLPPPTSHTQSTPVTQTIVVAPALMQPSQLLASSQPILPQDDIAMRQLQQHLRQVVYCPNVISTSMMALVTHTHTHTLHRVKLSYSLVLLI